MFDVAAIVNQDTTILFIIYNEIFILIFLYHKYSRLQRRDLCSSDRRQLAE